MDSKSGSHLPSLVNVAIFLTLCILRFSVFPFKSGSILGELKLGEISTKTWTSLRDSKNDLALLQHLNQRRWIEFHILSFSFRNMSEEQPNINDGHQNDGVHDEVDKVELGSHQNLGQQETTVVEINDNENNDEDEVEPQLYHNNRWNKFNNYISMTHV